MTPAAYALAGVLAALYLVGELARRCGAPALVGEIIVGLVLGPYGLDVVPQTRACTIAGELGLALLVLEGGLHVDLKTLREVGGVASALRVAERRASRLAHGLGVDHRITHARRERALLDLVRVLDGRLGHADGLGLARRGRGGEVNARWLVGRGRVGALCSS